MAAERRSLPQKKGWQYRVALGQEGFHAALEAAVCQASDWQEAFCRSPEGRKVRCYVTMNLLQPLCLLDSCGVSLYKHEPTGYDIMYIPLDDLIMLVLLLLGIPSWIWWMALDYKVRKAKEEAKKFWTGPPD